MSRTRDAEAELNLPPGFRFHPTDEELVVHYLCRKAAGRCLPVPIIAEIDLYKFNPWDIIMDFWCVVGCAEKALFGKKEWYFFTPRDRKYPNGSRPNRAAGTGYWKATGADKPISPKGSNATAGIKKALVFYSGRRFSPRRRCHLWRRWIWRMTQCRTASEHQNPTSKMTVRCQISVILSAQPKLLLDYKH